MFKRIGLLVLANLAVFIMLSVILTVVQMVFGVNFGTMAGSSLNLSALFIFSMVVGFSGSIISLLMSKQMAKMSMGVQMIDTNNPQPGLEAYLVGVVRHEAERAASRCLKSASTKASPTPSRPAPPPRAPWWPSPRGFSTS